jgi:hypothetical protein
VSRARDRETRAVVAAHAPAVRLALTALLAFAAGCASHPGPAARASLDPSDSVEVVLTRWYDAIAAHDSLGIAAPLLPEFFLFEDTTVVSRERLIAGLLAGAGAGSQSTHLSDFRTVVTDSVAWTSLRNHEVWTPAKGAPMPFDFLETVVFRKRAGRWGMERYHATRVERATR